MYFTGQNHDAPKRVMRYKHLFPFAMKSRRVLTSFKIGIMMIFIKISFAVRPSQTGRPRIDWKVFALYLLLIGALGIQYGHSQV
jgi:hypothetical protein